MAKCPLCGKYKDKKSQILDHMEEVHSEDIPEGYSTAMFYYSLYHNGKTTGQCRVCKKPTPWREEAGKPAQLCGSQACKDIMREQATKNMMKVYNKKTLLDMPEHQAKMLANRKISGTYQWSDGRHKFTYVGTYEKHAVEFEDKVLGLNPDGIDMPGPAIPYEHEGKTKFWLTDQYLEDFNLIVEIKDGGDNKNTHPGFAYNREIEAIKDNLMKNQTQFNYIKLTNKNMLPLIEMLATIRNRQLIDNSTTEKDETPLVVINETASEGLYTRQYPIYILLAYDNILNTFTSASLSFDLYLNDMYSKFNSILFQTEKNDILFTKNCSGIVLKYVGKQLDSGRLHAFVQGGNISIDEQIIPDSFHLMKELLREIDYEVCPDGIPVTPMTFLSSSDFRVVERIDCIPDWDYEALQEAYMMESAEIEADEIVNSVMHEGVGEYVELFRRTSVVDLLKNKIKNVKSAFNKVEVKDGIIEIRGISFKRLMENLKDLYDERGLYKIFEPQYKLIDQIMFERKKIRGKKRRIEYISAHEFFALELFKMFEELYEKYKYRPYATVAEDIFNMTWISKTNEDSVGYINLSPLDKLSYKLTDYQTEFVQEYNRAKTRCGLNGLVLSFEQGLGKTLTSVALAECLHKEVVYIVCPNSLKENWAYEIKQYYKEYSEDEEKWRNQVFIVDDKSFNYTKDTKYIICNNESIPKMYNYIEKNKDSIIIVDESQNFRSLGKRSNDLLKLKELTNVSDVLMMSGTPIKSTPNEIIPALMMIDPLFTEEVAKVYDKCFNIEGTLASNIVKERFSRIIWRRTKEDALKLPEKYTSPMKLKINNSDKYILNNVRDLVIKEFNVIMGERHKENDKLAKQFVEIVTKYSSNDKQKTKEYLDYIVKTTNTPIEMDLHELTQKEYDNFLNDWVYINMNDAQKEELHNLVTNYIHMKQSSMGRAIGKILPKYRSEMFIELYKQNKGKFIDMINNNKAKTVIFTSILDVANYIYSDLESSEIGAVKIVGGSKDRMDSIIEFKEDDSVDVLVATTQTLSTGVTLTEANQMFFFGTPWRSTDYDQACDRIHRMGQANDVYIYTVLLDTGKFKNISSRMQEILDWSNTMFSSMVGSIPMPDVEEKVEEDLQALNEAINELYLDYDRYSEVQTIEPHILIESASKHDDEIPLTPDERKEIMELFGKQECAFHHSKKGYYAKTHRCRTPYYKKISDIPISKVEFVSSTS